MGPLVHDGEYSSDDNLVDGRGEESSIKEPGGGKSPVDSGCGLLDGVRLDGPLTDPVDDPEFCGSGSSSSQFSTSDQPGLGGTSFQSGAFFDDWSHGSHRFCDAAVPSPATSTASSRASDISRTPTGAARAKLITVRVSRIQILVLNRRIFEE